MNLRTKITGSVLGLLCLINYALVVYNEVLPGMHKPTAFLKRLPKISLDTHAMFLCFILFIFAVLIGSRVSMIVLAVFAIILCVINILSGYHTIYVISLTALSCVLLLYSIFIVKKDKPANV